MASTRRPPQTGWISLTSPFPTTEVVVLRGKEMGGRHDEDRDEEERQREEAKQALAAPVQVDVVRAARLRRLATPTSGRGNSSTGGGSS